MGMGGNHHSPHLMMVSAQARRKGRGTEADCESLAKPFGELTFTIAPFLARCRCSLRRGE